MVLALRLTPAHFGTSTCTFLAVRRKGSEKKGKKRKGKVKRGGGWMIGESKERWRRTGRSGHPSEEQVIGLILIEASGRNVFLSSKVRASLTLRCTRLLSFILFV